jgi:hypothetical protein
MEPDRPLTAKEAVLRDVQADKLPFNREAERRFMIASTIRRISELTGQSEQATDDDGQAEDGSESTSGTLNQPTDSPYAGDLSLAQMIIADQMALGLGGPQMLPPALNESSPSCQIS